MMKLAVLKRGGALTADAAAAWRERFERLSGWRWPRREVRGLRESARGFIEHLAASFDAKPVDRELEARFRGALLAFDGTELFSPAETLRWINRVRLAAPDPQRLPPKGMPPFDDSRLLRVIAPPEARAAGLRTTAVELYEGGVVVQWQYDPAAARPSAQPPILGVTQHFLYSIRPEVSDNVGTRYYAQRATHGQYGFELDERAIGRSSFVPAVPERARRLKISLGQEAVTVPLRR